MGACCSEVDDNVIDVYHLKEASDQAKELLGGTVYMLVVSNNKKIVWDNGPLDLLNQTPEQIITTMFNGEISAGKLNDALSSDSVHSFRLNCQHSRMLMYSVDTNDQYKLIIVNYLKTEESDLKAEPPDFDDQMKNICIKVEDSIQNLLSTSTEVPL